MKSIPVSATHMNESETSRESLILREASSRKRERHGVRSLQTIAIVVLIVGGSTGCRSGAAAISKEELQVLIPPGMDSRSALQLIASRGYSVKGPEIRDLEIWVEDSDGEQQQRVWKEKNIAYCSIKVNSNPFDLVSFSNVIYVVIDDNLRVEETISQSYGFGP